VLQDDSLAPARSCNRKIPDQASDVNARTCSNKKKRASSYRKLWTLSDYEDIGYDDECG
jgi:hypothetical protein